MWKLRISKWFYSLKKKHQGTDKQEKCIKSLLLFRQSQFWITHVQNTVLWICVKWGKNLWAIHCFLCLQRKTFRSPKEHRKVTGRIYLTVTLRSQCWSKCLKTPYDCVSHKTGIKSCYFTEIVTFFFLNLVMIHVERKHNYAEEAGVVLCYLQK